MKILFILLFSILSLASKADDRATIERHLHEKDDKKAMRHILLELEDKDEVAIDTFVNQFIDICTEQEREYLKNQVVMRLYVASTPKQPTGTLLTMMRRFGILIGDHAPDFAINDSTMLYDLLGEYTLLFFYERSCNLCHNELNNLITNREDLEEKGINIISIDCNVAETISQVWKYNLADPDGKIYHGYGILSTPTFILLDKDGKVIKRSNTFNSIQELNN